MRVQKKYNNADALARLMKYCAYQERCHFEIERKLYEWGFRDEESRGNIILKLLEYDFLNEERFARAFVRGKYKIKKWGRQKIIYELKQRKISDNLITIVMTEINDDIYRSNLKALIEKKSKVKHVTKVADLLPL